MSLHGRIMNIQTTFRAETADYSNSREAYKYGHRDARHDAAELALKADAVVEALRDMVAMMNANEEHGAGSEWHKQAVKALSDLEKP